MTPCRRVDGWGWLRYGPAIVRRGLCWLNIVIALVTLASALAVLVSDLSVAGYRAHYRDAVWFVALYVTVQFVMLVGFTRDGVAVPWLVVAKTTAAYLFLLNFVSLWPTWRTWTPARYVYQLFDWGESTRIGLFALVFLGRGAFNSMNALALTRVWWAPLRHRRPLLGRLVTAVPITATALSVWAFVALVREEAVSFSPAAQEIARRVLDALDCTAVRANQGKTTTDLRQGGERRYHVSIVYDCALTRVLVQAEDGRVGTAAAPRFECCGGSPP